MEFSLKLVEVLYGKEIAKLVDWRERWKIDIIQWYLK
jgi:hypothetical protein